jgi:hypothetical protein
VPIEKAPRHPVPRNVSLANSTNYRVKTGDSWASIARDNGLQPAALIRANYRTIDPAEVNWYLHHYVGCRKTTADGHNYVFDSADSPGLIGIPQTGMIHFLVPMQAQAQNPICWIACVAMISSFKGRTSRSISQFTGGYEVANSSIPSMGAWDQKVYDRLRTFGFVTENAFPNETPDPSYIENLLRAHGPFLLAFWTTDILPGPGMAGTAHAIVIPGIDPATNRVWYNNPWGLADQVTSVGTVLVAMEKFMNSGWPPVAYLP